MMISGQCQSNKHGSYDSIHLRYEITYKIKIILVKLCTVLLNSQHYTHMLPERTELVTLVFVC